MVVVRITWFREGLSEEADAVVVIDVLRFSTTVAVALGLGFKHVYAFSELSNAINFARLRKLPLLAEVRGLKPQEADLDNSPSELMKHGATYLKRGINELVIRTTSGATIVSEAAKQGFRNIFISSTVNARSVAKALLSKRYSTVNIVCAGLDLSKFAIEDFAGAGALIEELTSLEPGVVLEDEGLAALHMYRSARETLLELFSRGRSGKIVTSTGHYEDIVVACRVNSLNVVPQATPLNQSDGALISLYNF
ncbi:MAG: 2-phosphosulfolactate phosphatase [Thermosphaera sp.]